MVENSYTKDLKLLKSQIRALDVDLTSVIKEMDQSKQIEPEVVQKYQAFQSDINVIQAQYSKCSSLFCNDNLEHFNKSKKFNKKDIDQVIELQAEANDEK